MRETDSGLQVKSPPIEVQAIAPDLACRAEREEKIKNQKGEKWGRMGQNGDKSGLRRQKRISEESWR
jgi:hypothetical protein